MRERRSGGRWLAGGLLLLAALGTAWGNDKVYVSRFWHNHQPIYWPEWNAHGDQDQRVQYAWDSIVLKPGQNYGGLSPSFHPENNLTDIFGLDDRRNAYQGGPRQSLTTFGSAGGFALSYSGALIDNIRQLGAVNQLGYGGGWANGNREARGWFTPSGSRRMDLVGFTYHHSLAPLLPKAVFRKELQLFKQAWWKAWNGQSDLGDHSKGFFPTEMAYTRDLIDVLVDEGYEWVIVASHHISRTTPTYFDQFDLANNQYGIFSSPPNRADLLGPSPTTGWWYSEPNPGNAAWNVAPYAYQLHRVKYVNPETGAEKSMLAVPSDDVLSYRYGYANEGIGKIGSFISPFANDPARPVLVMPSTDGDNAWGGGSSSWMEATPQLFNESANAGYRITTVQDFVNAHGAAAPYAHIEDGAWIFPESDYGSPYFLKWIEPPVRNANATNVYPGTVVDLETPGFALKFYSYAPLMAGANWCETAEQIWRDAGGDVQAWKIQAPYDWNGAWTSPNVVELAWHIYLKGLDSGFNYYGGLGNDDEVKPSLATRRAIERLQGYLPARLADDRTPPTVLKPQRFPYNPGGHTFGWFNSIPGGDTRYLKKMPSAFYIWTQAYDVSGVESVTLKIRRDLDGVRSLAHNQNLTYAGGADVGPWVSIPMQRRVLPRDRATLNALANNGQIDFFITSPEVADYYFVHLTDANLPGFRGRLFDYYIEARDARGNLHKSEIQHVFVEDDGLGSTAPFVTFSPDPRDCVDLGVVYHAAGGPLENVSPVYQQTSFDGGQNWSRAVMNAAGSNVWSLTTPVPDNAPSATVWFENAAGTLVDGNGGLNWSTAIRDCEAPVGPSTVQTLPAFPAGCDPVTIRYYPNQGPLATATNVRIHIGRNGWSEVLAPAPAMAPNGYYWEYTYVVPTNTTIINFVFHNGAGVWDNNHGADWSVNVAGCGTEQPPPPPASVQPPAPAGCAPVTIIYNPSGRPLLGAPQVFLHVGCNGWQDVILPNPAMTASGAYWTYLYTPPPGTHEINVVFNNGGATWDNNDGLDWAFAVTDCEPLPRGLVITNPPANLVVSNAVSHYTLAGAGVDVIGVIQWTNALTGAHGDFPAAAEWTLPEVALLVGGNAVTVSGTNVTVAGVMTNAADRGSDLAYDGGWTGFANGGTGFGLWELSTDGGVAGHFVESGNSNILISGGARVWGLFAQEGTQSQAWRAFAQPLQAGDRFQVSFENGWVREGGGSVGVALQNPAGSNLWQFFFNGGDDYYSRHDGVTDLPWTADGVRLELEIAEAGQYALTVRPVGGSDRFFAGALTAQADATPSRLRVWSASNGAGSEYNVYIDDLRVTRPILQPVRYTDTVIITRGGDVWTTDSNNDGLPDGWYLQYGQNPFGASVANENWDDDAFTNLEEHWLGTDPYSAASGLIMESLVALAGEWPRISWQSVGGRQYTVEYSDDLTQPGGGFETLTTVVENDVALGVADTAAVDDTTLPPGASGRHYRVRFDGIP